MADEHPILEMIRERQYQITGQCLHMPKDEPANIYVIYKSKISRSNRHGNQGTDKTVRFSAEEIANYVKYKQLWNLSITMHKLPTWWWLW